MYLNQVANILKSFLPKPRKTLTKKHLEKNFGFVPCTTETNVNIKPVIQKEGQVNFILLITSVLHVGRRMRKKLEHPECSAACPYAKV